MYFRAFIKNLIYSGLNFLSCFIPRKSCSILMYHSVSDHQKLYVVSPENFQRQMEYLHKERFNVIPLARLADLLANKQEIPDKTVVLTFDDGYEDNYLNVFPILKKYNFSATVFLSTGFVGGERENKSQSIVLKILSWPQIEEMHNSGLVDFQPHTISHPKLAKIPLIEAKKEIMESKKIIEERLNKNCRFFSYPYGNYNQEIVEILRQNNFQAAVTVEKGVIRSGHASGRAGDNLLELKRNFVYFHCGFSEFKGISGSSFKII